MSEPIIINYRVPKYSEILVASDDFNLKLSKEIIWSSDNSDNKQPKYIFDVEGKVQDRQYSYVAKWHFSISEAEIERLESSILELRPPEEIFKSAKPEKETYIDVYSFLRIGWAVKEKNDSWYAEFSKDNLKLRTSFSEFNGLVMLRDFFYTARKR